MKKKLIIFGSSLLVIILIVIRLAGNYSKIQEKKVVKDNSHKIVSVSSDRAIKKDVNKTLDLVGTTIAKNEVLLQAEIAAQVASVNFNIGNYVGAGKLLVKLDDRTQTYALENAQLNLSRLEDEYNRVKSIYAGKAGTETQLRDSRIAYENAKIGVEQAKRQLEFTKITAPFGGTIYQKSVEKGGYVGVGAPILALVDLSALKASINVAEKDAYLMKVGQKTTITSQVFPGITFSGKVSYIAPKADKWHNYPVEVVIENQKANQLRSGTFVSVNFDFGTTVKTLVIPRKSLQGSIKDASVYVIEANTAHLKKVTLGKDYGEYLEVLNGLNENDEVVTTGQLNLTDGSSVAVVK